MGRQQTIVKEFVDRDKAIWVNCLCKSYPLYSLSKQLNTEMRYNKVDFLMLKESIE